MNFDTYLRVMLEFIEPEANEVAQLEQIERAEAFIRLVTRKFRSYRSPFNSVSPLIPYPEFVCEITGVNRTKDATRLFELFWQENSILDNGNWKPGDAFPFDQLAGLKRIYVAWKNQRLKEKKKVFRGKKGP
jgi:hypothetical protein